jgi:ABC-type transport system involved in cytochrome bd biosynthesis fused ATPase/permease subunit
MKSKDLRLLLSLSGSRRLFIGALLGALLSAFIVITNALLIGALIVGIIYSHPSNGKYTFALAMLWLFRASFTSNFEYWCSYEAARLKRQLRASITKDPIGNLSIGSAELTGVLIKGSNSLDIYLGRFLPQMLGASFVPFAVIFTIFLFDPLSAIITIVTLPLIPIFGALIGKYTNDAVSKKWKSLGTLSKYFEDSLQGFLTLKIFGRDKSQGERIRLMGDKYTDETMKVLKVSFLSALVLELAATISVALIAVEIGLRLVEGNIPFITGLTVLILAPEVYFPLRSAASLFHASADGSEILARILSLQRAEMPVKPSHKVTFSAFDSLSWNDWDLNIPGVIHTSIPAGRISRGECLFIIGDSGAGKSTFAENLLGIHSDIEIKIDEKRLLASEVNSFQKSLGWIPQLPQLAPGTIRDQFNLVAPGISDREIEEICEAVSLQLRDLPYGLSTYLGGANEKSAQLSGGQTRKVAVARALIRKPSLIIADEPTADLDGESSLAIMTALRSAVAEGAALICITHERESIISTDRTLEVERVKT